MSNGEFHRKYVHCMVVPNSVQTDKQMVSKPLAHKIAPCHITTTPSETGLTAPPMKGTFQCIPKSLHLLVGRSVHNKPIIHV